MNKNELESSKTGDMSVIEALKELVLFVWGQILNHVGKLKIKLKIIAFNNKRSNYYAYLGELVFRSVESKDPDPLSDRNIQKAIEEIQNIQKEVAESDRELNEIRDESYQKIVEMRSRKKVILDVLKHYIWSEEREDLKMGKPQDEPKSESQNPADKKESAGSDPSVEQSKTKNGTETGP